METPASLNDLQRATLAIVLAGGRGTRLGPLTNKRVKPAVHFGGKYRIIDFALSNCLNSGIRRIAVVTQYKAHSLIRHVQRGWGFLRGEFNEFIDLWPAQQRVEGGHWYRGTADAVFQNLDIIRSIRPKYVVVLAGDHIYKMDYTRMIRDHVESGADCTVGCIEVPRMDAVAFGVMHVDENRRVTGFVEKPADPPAMPGRPDMALASMGIYVFNADYLYTLLDENHSACRVSPRIRTSSRTGAMSARSTLTGPPISTSPRRSRRSTCTIPTGPSGRNSSSCRRPSSCAT
jgi:glucose-1-phosphate adenylyltransferase